MDSPDRRAPCPCGSGRRSKSCCFATDRARQDASVAAAAGHERIEAALRRVLPVIEAEHPIACRGGCSSCCASYVRATPAEALLVADWLARPEAAEARAGFRARLPAWRAGAAELGPRLEAMLEGGDRSDPAAQEAYQALSQEYLRRDNMCPFHDGARCEIYPVRPTVCRAVYVVETSRYCRPDQGGLPRTVMSPVIEQALAETVKELRRASAQLPGGGRKRALPELIAELLRQDA